MKSLKNEFLRRFLGLSPRERFMSVTTAIGTVFYVLYLLIYEPIAAEKTLLAQKISAQQQTFRHLKKISEDVLAIRKNYPATLTDKDQRSLIEVIDASSKQLEIAQATKRMIPDGANKVTLWLEGIAFDKLIHWLALLEQDHAVVIFQVSVNQVQKQPGSVNAKLVLGN